jgi:hypothetical protein
VVQNLIPRYKTSYLGTKPHTEVKNLIPRYKTLYRGM